MAQSRQLAAIMFTDIVGYTASMGANERRAFELLQKSREIQGPIIEKYHGKLIKELGDGLLASFQSVSDAACAAIDIQERTEAEHAFRLRIGIHLGEVVFENNDIFGDGVNIASRIQAIAEPGTIYVSESVHDNLFNKTGIRSTFVKKESLKNVREPVNVYRVTDGSGQPGNEPASARESRNEQEKSIAVLPFSNMSNDPDQEFFSDGIAEEILNSLARVQDLKVAGRTSSFQFKGKNVDLREIGRKLGVNTILEGSLRKQGNRIRITAQLVDPASGFHLWSERFDRDIEDVFAIQDEIAAAITEKLKLTLLEKDRLELQKQCTRDPEAYQWYLKGRFLWNKRTEESMATSVRYFQKSIEIDPQYALAWAGLADSYNLLGEHSRAARKDFYPQCRAAALKALEIDDQLAEAHISLASLLMLEDRDWIRSGNEFRLGIRLKPEYATGHHWYTEWLLAMARPEEALASISTAVELDPVAPGMIKDKGFVYYYLRQYENAIRDASLSLELDPALGGAYRLLSLAYLGMGLYKESLEANDKWAVLTGYRFKPEVAKSMILAASGEREAAGRILGGYDEAAMNSGEDFRGLALAFLALGDKDKALECMDKAIRNFEVSVSTIRIDPKLDALRSHPAYNELLARMGFPEHVQP